MPNQVKNQTHKGNDLLMVRTFPSIFKKQERGMDMPSFNEIKAAISKLIKNDYMITLCVNGLLIESETNKVIAKNATELVEIAAVI